MTSMMVLVCGLCRPSVRLFPLYLLNQQTLNQKCKKKNASDFTSWGCCWASSSKLCSPHAARWLCMCGPSRISRLPNKSSVGLTCTRSKAVFLVNKLIIAGADHLHWLPCCSGCSRRVGVAAPASPWRHPWRHSRRRQCPARSRGSVEQRPPSLRSLVITAEQGAGKIAFLGSLKTQNP